MTEPTLPDFLIVGPQKCATTWLYECLYEHPEVLMPETDSVHYFDMFYHNDEMWYSDYFSAYNGESVIGEETPTYIRDEKTPERIAETLPDVKLIFTLRNPIDRAFSHWWHERSKGKHSFEFEEVFENFDLYQNWIVPGFYHRHLMRYIKYFSEDQIKICFMSELIEDDLSYIQDVYSFIGVDNDFVPSQINKKSNQGKYRLVHQIPFYYDLVDLLRQILPQPIISRLRPAHALIKRSLSMRNDYDQGMKENTRRQLEEHFVDDVRQLQSYVEIELNHWFDYKYIQ